MELEFSGHILRKIFQYQI